MGDTSLSSCHGKREGWKCISALLSLPLSCSSMPWEGTSKWQNSQAVEAFASLGFCRGEWEAEGAVLR